MADHETPSSISEVWTAANRTRSLALSDYIRLTVSVLAAKFGSAAISRKGREAINRSLLVAKRQRIKT